MKITTIPENLTAACVLAALAYVEVVPNAAGRLHTDDYRHVDAHHSSTRTAIAEVTAD
jgi:hypothetical protein